MEKHGANELYSAVKSLMHAIWNEDKEAQQDAVHRMIQIATSWMIRKWSHSKLTNRKPILRIQNQNAHLFASDRTEDEKAQLKPVVERFTLRGASESWRVH